MLDTARHFFSVDYLKKLIDNLSLAKFSVLHWHIVDDESFPLDIASQPTLAKNAAYSAKEVYTTQDALDIVAYAAKVGIRVIPEFDNPGHTRALGLDPNFNDIIRCFNKNWYSTVPGAYKVQGGPPTGVMDPSSDKTFQFITGLFKDFDSIFTDNMIMLGGDEVLTSCYKENPKIYDFMDSKKLATFEDLFQYHIDRTK